MFGKSGTVPDAVWLLTELFNDTVLTTNYDRLLEQALGAGHEDRLQIINALMRSEQPDAKRTTIVKLHGDITKPGKCILSKNQYDDAYGADALDLSLPIPKLLSHYYQNASLLFLGCSLNNDRTVQVFRAVRQQAGDADLKQHFSFEQACDNPEVMATRNAMLESLGITAIWFEKDRFDLVERLLELARDELNHRRSLEPDQRGVKSVEEPEPEPLQLDVFIRDFVALMPLLYWLHRHVPETATSRYLGAMQQVFHAYSFFTEGTSPHLLYGLDLVLRALSNEPEFDGYTHEKLSAAFRCFRGYFDDISKPHQLTSDFDWNIHELLVIPMLGFEALLNESPEIEGLDLYAVRLCIALFRFGLKQERSPNEFCELPNSVNAEFGDYLALTLSAKLGLLVPDRLDDLLTDNIKDLCQSAWETKDTGAKPNFITRVKFALFGF